MKYYDLGPFFIRVNSRSALHDQVPVDRAGAKTKEFDSN